jgi:hypothetical protein
VKFYNMSHKSSTLKQWYEPWNGGDHRNNTKGSRLQSDDQVCVGFDFTGLCVSGHDVFDYNSPLITNSGIYGDRKIPLGQVECSGFRLECFNDSINMSAPFKKIPFGFFIYSLTINMMYYAHGKVKGGWVRDTVRGADTNDPNAYKDIDMSFPVMKITDRCKVCDFFMVSAVRIFRYMYGISHCISITANRKQMIGYNSCATFNILVDNNTIASYDLNRYRSLHQLHEAESSMDFAQNSLEFRLSDQGLRGHTVYAVSTIYRHNNASNLPLKLYMISNEQIALRAILELFGFNNSQSVSRLGIGCIISDFVGVQFMNQYTLMYTLCKRKPEMFACNALDRAGCTDQEQKRYDRNIQYRGKKFQNRGYKVLNLKLHDDTLFTTSPLPTNKRNVLLYLPISVMTAVLLFLLNYT